MKRKFDEKNLIVFLLLFVLIQTVIDFNFLTSYDSIQILGLSIPTLIRLIGVFIIFLLYLVTKDFKKHLLWVIIYLVTVFAYFVFHHQNAMGFTSLIPGNFNYGIKEEIFYIIRLLIPIFIGFVSYRVYIKEKDFKYLIYVIVLIISGSIVISNIFEIGLGSYNNIVIKGSIFNWFTEGSYDFAKYATKGWFANANAISSLLTLLLPIVLYYNVIEKNNKWYILLIIQFLSMLMIGTKVATWGAFIELIVFIIIYLFFIIIKKEVQFDYKAMLKLLLISVVFLMIYPFSPSYQRIATDQERFKRSDKEQKLKLENLQNELKNAKESEIDLIKINFIENEFDNFSIKPHFINYSYNYKYDSDFWINIFHEDYPTRTNFRLIEQKMFNRLLEIDNRDTNKFLGLTYSRLSKVFTLEKDFVYQYYTLGIVGLLLLVIIYILCIAYAGIKTMFFNKFYFKNVILILSLSVCICAAYMSGNVIDTLMVMILFGFITGQLIRIISNEK